MKKKKNSQLFSLEKRYLLVYNMRSMEYVVGILIAVLNQSLLYWRMQQLKHKNIVEPKQVVNLARISLIERLLLIGIVLVLAMQRFDPLSVILSFFIINLGFAFYKQCQLKQ
ncbi:MAG: hypothetical protein ISR70_02375 [Candidatus Thioglobus sp.]|nr:hypothetical protein [Candidatus Thioglobus pontius]MBL6976889.1 hypothetical protein [Candidatus Thioglobus sp.]MBL6984607.1 hypothetical protein [Candidatus Thioglobus sp.]